MRSSVGKKDSLRNPQSKSYASENDERSRKVMSGLSNLSEISFNEETYLKNFKYDSDAATNDLEKILNKNSAIFSEQRRQPIHEPRVFDKLNAPPLYSN